MYSVRMESFTDVIAATQKGWMATKVCQSNSVKDSQYDGFTHFTKDYQGLRLGNQLCCMLAEPSCDDRYKDVRTEIAFSEN